MSAGKQSAQFSSEERRKCALGSATEIRLHCATSQKWLNDFPIPESLIVRLARDVAIVRKQAEAAVELLDGGATVPFIARYRKEVTNGLDDAQLCYLDERLIHLRDLESGAMRCSGSSRPSNRDSCLKVPATYRTG